MNYSEMSYLKLKCALIACVAILLFCTKSQAQNAVEPITIAELSLTIPGAMEAGVWMNDHPNQKYPYPKYEYGFAEGDQIVLNFQTENKNGTQVLEVKDVQSGAIVYSNQAFQTLDDVRIRVPKKAVYSFEFATNHMFARSCKFTLKRIPANEKCLNFNCNVTWMDRFDTTYSTVEEKVPVKTVYNPVTLQSPEIHYVNSGSNASFKGGKSRVLIPVNLPPNTIEWYYKVSAFRDQNQIEQTKANLNLMSEIADVLGKSSGVYGIGSALNFLTHPPGSDYTDIYLLTYENSGKFVNKVEHRYILEGTRENVKSGVVNVRQHVKDGPFYLGIKNPDFNYGVHVAIEIVAITKEEQMETRMVKKPVKITAIKTPVFGN